MLDNICSLTLSSDIFAQAIHPTAPILSVGLSGGHVETFRLPVVNDEPHVDVHAETNGLGIKSSLSRRDSGQSENGFDVVDSTWRTRRHKGSCRTLAFSWDGDTLYSAGTDGLIKAAATTSGKVTSKIALARIAESGTPIPDSPSVLRILSPQTLILGSDLGYVHVYDLREPAQSLPSRPSQAFRPHATDREAGTVESISSLTPLPPNSTSTSGMSRLWVSTSGPTLAALDLRKGVVAVSEDQGDVLMSSACLPGSSTAPGSHPDKIVVGGMSGSISLWNRGQWGDRTGRYSVGGKKDPYGDDEDIEQMAVVPEGLTFLGGISGQATVAAGLSNGRVAFVKIHPKRAAKIGEVSHDDRGVDGVTTLGFDVSGRMISGGGALVKIWHEKMVGTDVQEELAEEAGEQLDSNSDASTSDDKVGADSDDEDALEYERAKPKKKRRKNAAGRKHGDHGIMGFQAMD